MLCNNHLMEVLMTLNISKRTLRVLTIMMVFGGISVSRGASVPESREDAKKGIETQLQVITETFDTLKQDPDKDGLKEVEGELIILLQTAKIIESTGYIVRITSLIYQIRVVLLECAILEQKEAQRELQLAQRELRTVQAVKVGTEEEREQAVAKAKEKEKVVAKAKEMADAAVVGATREEKKAQE